MPIVLFVPRSTFAPRLRPGAPQKIVPEVVSSTATGFVRVKTIRLYRTDSKDHPDNDTTPPFLVTEACEVRLPSCSVGRGGNVQADDEVCRDVR